MYATLKFEGMIDRILEEAVKEGLAKTKSEALRLGALELNNRYGLLEKAREEAEDLEDARYVRKARKLIAEGKLKILDEGALNKVRKR